MKKKTEVQSLFTAIIISCLGIGICMFILSGSLMGISIAIKSLLVAAGLMSLFVGSIFAVYYPKSKNEGLN